MKDGDDATQKSRHLRDERDAKLYGKMRELMTSDRGAPGAKAKVWNALNRVDSEFNQRGPDIALERQDAEVMGFCRDVVSKEAWKRWSANACQDAVKNDSIERLKFLHECECPWRKNKILYVCAEHGSTECMKYLLKHGCKFSNRACNRRRRACTTAAAEFGFLECLKYLRKHGCPWDEKTCSSAAGYGHLECLKYAHEHGCPWNEVTCAHAASNGHLDCLRYARENGCCWDKRTCEYAAKNGYLDCLRYAREHGCRWDSGTCKFAAKNGHLECLKYAHEQGCPWDEWTCSSAAYDGHLECLKYAHEHGCPWDENTCYNAAKNGHLECLKYACAHGCPGSAPYVKALKEVVLPDADERFVVEVALVFHRSGEISMREFLPLWAEHRMFYRKAHYEAVRKFHASLRLNR